MRQLRPLLVAVSLILCLTTIANAQDQSLQLGTAIERPLGPGQAQTFTITAEADQYVQFVVEQRGIDVVVRVFSPAGKSLGEFDSPNGDNGPENVSFVASERGGYRVVVAPLNLSEGIIQTGKFEIKIIELRQATDQELKTSKNLEAAKAKGLALLGEVDALIPEIHSPQTRIRAQLQAAQLLWESDEKRAWKYLNDAVATVREFLAALDPTTQEYQRDYSTIVQLRFEVVRVLADRDPDAALNFLSSIKAPPNPYNQRETTEQERGLELSIANQVVAKDPKKALEVARQSLKRGYSSSLANTISMLRHKNPDLATQLATDVVNKLLNEKLLKNSEAASLAVNLLGTCNSNQSQLQRTGLGVSLPQPLLPENTCRDLQQKTFQEALSFTPPGRNIYSPERDAAWVMLSGLKALGVDLDANTQGGAASVENKLKELSEASNPYQATVQQFQVKVQNGDTTDAAMESIQKAPEEIRDQLYIEFANTLAQKGEGARARQIINDHIRNPFQRQQILTNIQQQEIFQAMSRGKVDEALRTIASVRTPRERANMLMQIIRQIGPGQKRAAALSFLEQARSLVAPGVQAQDQEQMNVLLELARAFSRYDSKRGFEIIDPLVEQLNELCAAARTLEGFGMQYYEDDELDLQNGNVVANLATQLSGTLGTLAITNFERARLTSDRLRLPELRLHAYLAIAQQTIQGTKY